MDYKRKLTYTIISSYPLKLFNTLLMIQKLLITQVVASSRVQKLFKTLIGLAISEPVMLKYILQLNAALEPWEQGAIRQTRSFGTI